MNLCHYYPLNDAKPHVDGIFCECIPWVDEDDVSVVIHPAFDGRDLREYYKRA